ncbi:sigma-S stabilization anti-adapter protein IraP [Proteus faecis]|uniref:sigma-S stabilization anti-adapter protein IraP n=1 Tax=Proteus faecis TaxID=2050967 RepID=UPI000D691E9E|nr:sigma-S stabilization anti-adapter protein IraP [Proteus faecis]
MDKNLKEIECEIAALKIVIKSLLSTLSDKQRRDMLGNISVVLEDTSNKYPQFNEVINLTEQYVKKLTQP